VDSRQRNSVLTPPGVWRGLRDMQDVVTTQPDVAYAVRCLSLYDQLDLTLELLQQEYWPYFHELKIHHRTSFASARAFAVDRAIRRACL
jgi:hypothetical protein